MRSFRIGVVGMGHRGRSIAKLAVCFPGVELAAACDIRAHNWFEPQWGYTEAMAEIFPNAVFYSDYENMIA